MENIVKIKLWDEDIAVLLWNNDKEYGVIEFLDSFIQKKIDLSPIQIPMENLLRGDKIYSFPELKRKTFKGLPGLIADSLPDDYGNSVIDEWFLSKKIPIDVNPLVRLCYIGKRGMGALEFEPALKEDQLNESSTIEISELVDLASHVLNKRAQFQIDINHPHINISDILKVGTSAGGAKPKAIIALNEITGEVRSVQVNAPVGFSYWILKFDGVEGGKIKDNPMGIGRIEYAYYKMALDCFINISESKLLYDQDRAHFMTKRFDRTPNGEKIHTQTWCGLAHFDRDERYSYEQLFKTMRQLYLSYPDFEQMYRRMVFNVLARNHDDHTKNHSFIMNNTGEWSLAPAYDLCYSYSPSGFWTNKHQLSLNGKRDNFDREDLLKVGYNMDIKNPKIIIDQIVHCVSNWHFYAKEANVSEEYSQIIEKNVILL
jgi:serine/threonine-protein kinase HipA